MIDFPDEALLLCGVRGRLNFDDVMLAAKKANRVAPTQLLRADMVVSPDHLRSAAMHAQRALKEGRNHADRVEVEFTRYAAGERQIRRAIEKMGIPEDADAAIICAFGAKRKDAVDYFVDFLGLPEDDSLLEGDTETLTRFGITPLQLSATTPGREMDLVLEAVASVDLMRK